MRQTKMADKSISIRIAMIVVFIILTLITVSVIGYIVFSKWQASADETIKIMAKDMNVEISNEVDAFMTLPLHINEANYWQIENDIVDIDNEIERERFFVGVLRMNTNESVYSFSIGFENGEFYGARRNENNEIEIMRNNPDTGGSAWYYSVAEDTTAGERVVDAGKYDPRTRDWYKPAKEMQKPVFSPIYKHFVIDDLTVSAAHPIYKNGRFQGVLGTHITLGKINNRLKGVVKDKNAFAVIVEKNSGALVANSLDQKNFRTLKDGNVQRLTIKDLGNQAIIQAHEKYKSSEDSNFIIKNENDKLFINLREYHKDGLDLLVITAIPESLFIAGIVENMKLALLLTLIAIILSIVIYLMLTYKFLKPIYNLIDTTEKFSRGDLSSRATITRNDEIGRISKSFNNMADSIYMLVNNLEAKVKERTVELEETNHALKENKDQLENKKNHFQYIFENSPVMKAIVKDNRCIQVNKAWTDHTGYSYQEILETDVEKIAILKELSLCITSTSQVTDVIKEKQQQITYTTKANEKRTALVNYEKLSEANTTQCLVVALDITKQQQYETELAKLDRLHTIGKVAAAIAHEVRNPLTTIKGFTQIFSSKSEFQPYHEHLKLVIDEIDRANEIISEFLSLAKTDKSNIEVASINDEINEILSLLNVHALKENITIKTQFQTIPNTNICKHEFRQVILNIVNNALDVSEDGDTVWINTYQKDSHVIVSIADQGKGIPEEIQDKIGEPFYTTKTSGTGLGLAVCNTILHRHSGAMTFKSSNLGTTFYLHFPIVEVPN